ncbi:serine hydrolase [Lapidilactobacillus dextrinicus]|nr:hypothetical protein [Lapidilactobacillus dextrinicus]QFG46368.1 serine hydrolase [Lapidilactobacillus dextrinicus]
MRHRQKRLLFLTTTMMIFTIFIYHHQTQATSISNAASSSSTIKATVSKLTSTKSTTATKKATQLKIAWQKIMATTDSRVEIAVYDKNTNQTYQLANVSATTAIKTASIVKVSVLTELLKQNMTGDLTLTSTDEAYAKQMITESNNDATTYLLSQRLGGYTATQAVFDDLHMTHSTANTDAWGYATTTAADQLKLLNTIYYHANHYLATNSRTYAKNLMASVDASQDWGISAGATSYQVKNGWLNDTDGTWIINSIGHISATTDRDADYTIAILTDQNNSESSGIALVEKLAQATNTILND